ncbi:MAG: transporter associated domain-containing protein [Pilosibacter sp.]
MRLTGLTLLDDVEETLGVEFDKEDKDNFDTLNGFMVSDGSGHIPKVGEKGSVRIGDYLLKIMKVENKD